MSWVPEEEDTVRAEARAEAEGAEKARVRERDVQAALGEVWRDRLSTDALRSPVLVDLVAHCNRCVDTLAAEMSGSAARWAVRHGRIARADRGIRRHTRWGAGCASATGRRREPLSAS